MLRYQPAVNSEHRRLLRTSNTLEQKQLQMLIETIEIDRFRRIVEMHQDQNEYIDQHSILTFFNVKSLHHKPFRAHRVRRIN